MHKCIGKIDSVIDQRFWAFWSLPTFTCSTIQSQWWQKQPNSILHVTSQGTA